MNEVQDVKEVREVKEKKAGAHAGLFLLRRPKGNFRRIFQRDAAA